MMDAARWRCIEAVFTEALSKPPEARAAYLRHACADDSMRAELESLLEAYHASEAFLRHLTRSPPGSPRVSIPPLAAGTRLGAFEIVAPLGAGGMGVVYHARDTRLDRSVALKILNWRPDHADSSSEQLEREAHAISGVSHPNICTLYDVARAPVPPDDVEVEFLVMELVRGETMADVIARGPVSVDDTLRYGTQVADALARAHREGIVHRDLKPSNVMITPDGVKLLDFGLAAFTSNLTPTTSLSQPAIGTLGGTAQYMAPEQILGGDVDGRTDVFSLGVVLHEMLGGTRAFERCTLLETLHAILSEAPGALSETVPPALRSAVERCLAKDPDARFQSAVDLVETFRSIAATRSRGAHRAELPVRAIPRWRALTSRTGWTLAAILAMGIAVAGPRSEPPSLKVSRYVRLTNDGRLKTGDLVTDGARLYLSELAGRETVLVQVPASGGETRPVPVPFRNPGLDDMASRGSDLIVGNYGARPPFEYWLISPDGNPARRLGSLRAHDVHPSPDGRSLVYVAGPDVFVSAADGTRARRIATFPSLTAGAASWAPDGRRVRLSVFDATAGGSANWEVTTDGSVPRPVFPGWMEPPAECCGRWTSDGAYYIFQAGKRGMTSLWAVREEGRRWSRSRVVPVKLTDGPLHFRSPTPGSGSRTIYAIGDQVSGEIMRRDPGSGEWTPYALGSSVRSMAELTFSPDGSRLAYVGYPEETLWTSKVDGTDDRQLTGSPMRVSDVSWAPDGKRLVFSGQRAGGRWRIFVIAVTGGTPEPLIPGHESEAAPDWSPDGDRIVFGGSPFFDPGTSAPTTLRVIDVRTRQVTDIPGAEGLWAPRWSPDGRYIVAHRFDFTELRLLDVATGRWEQLARGVLHHANWSRDSQFVFFESWGEDVAVIRMRMQDRQRATVASLKQFRRTAGPERSWSGLTPDNSLLVLRHVGSQEVYELSLREGSN